MNHPIVSNSAIHNEGDAYKQLLQSIESLSAQEAICNVKNFLQTYPSFATAHNDLGVLYLRAGNSTLALAHYEKAARLQPENTTFKKNLADFYAVELGWYDDAVDMYLEILKKNPRDTEALIALGHLGNALQGGASELSEPLEKPALTQTIFRQPDFLSDSVSKEPEQAPQPIYVPTTEQLHSSAVELLQNGKNREAISILEQLIAKDPIYASAYNDLAIAYEKDGELEKARKYHEKALQLQPDNCTFKKNLADFLYLAFGDTEAALHHYLELLKQYPKDIETLTALAQIAIENEKLDDSKTFLKSILAIEPWNKNARETLAAISDVLKKNEVKQKQSASDMHNEALRHAEAERHDQAESLLREMLEAYPDYAIGHNDLGVVLYRKGDLNGSHRSYQKAVELQPNNATFRKNLADILYSELGKTDDAIAIYLDLIKQFPRDIEALSALAQICEANNHPDEAKIFYRRALEIEPWNMGVRKALQSL